MSNLEDFLDDFSFEAEDMSKTTEVLHYHKDERLVDTESISKRVDFYSFLPNNETLLGLDISKSSTGWCLIKNKKRTTGNIHLTGHLAKKNPQYKELMYRVELKQELEKLFKGMTFDHIMIEDVFQGANAKTVRLLYDINTAIDELIYEGVVKCKSFHRISNQKWKSWLYNVDTYEETKALADKQRIQACMAMIGITETGEGFQDRLDSTGLIAGYFINEATTFGKEVKKVNFSMSDIRIRYRKDREDALAIRANVMKISDGPIEVTGNISKSLFERCARRNPDAVYITKERVSLGFTGENKNLKPIEGGGYLVFWVKPTSRSKYKD